MMRRASITLYLCLILSVLLSLTAVSFYSARIAAGRAVLASSLEEGLYSLFSEYDADLFERYGLLFIDGGRGQPSLQLHRLTDRTEQYASYVLKPGRGTAGGKTLIAMSEPAASITAYTLATDGAGRAFLRQICTAMKGKLAANAVKKLSGDTDGAGALSAGQQAQMPQMLSDSSVSEQEQAAADTIELGEDYQDPRETVTAARKLGLLNLVIPAGRVVSGQSVDLSQMPSGRSLQRGIGGIVRQQGGLADHALLTEYAAEYFSCFTEAETKDDAGLQYQLEYLICRK